MIQARKKNLTRKDVLGILRAEQSFLKEKFGIEKIALFGSFARGNPTLKSDVDLVIRLGRQLGFEFFDMVDYLEKKLGRKVDALTPAGIESIRVKSIAEDIKRSMIDV